jgi:hypothetical protein
VISREPGALQLRTLQTLAEVATERDATLVFPIPVEDFALAQKLIDEGKR